MTSPRRAGGSSPHTRGARGFHAAAVVDQRIIPAYAGSTDSFLSLEACDEDHPRIRGEHFSFRIGPGLLPGSSPHTRGALAMPARTRRGWGIIPAYAGSTTGSAAPGTSDADHPRIRGEHVAEMFKFPDHPGSSPHTRGAPLVDGVDQVLTRIIPAYAGSTSPDEAIPMKSGDHPRIRGEHFLASEMQVTRPGSSPHTRGAHDGHSERLQRGRIIPAYAGSTG